MNNVVPTSRPDAEPERITNRFREPPIVHIFRQHCWEKKIMSIPYYSAIQRHAKTHHSIRRLEAPIKKRVEQGSRH